MNSSTITFLAWSKNHPPDHYAKWCRELYPWELFRQLDYDQLPIDVPQVLSVGGGQYVATLKHRTVTGDDRHHYSVHIHSVHSGKRQEWNQRSWDDSFHLVASPSGEFITLFTKKKDPSKVVFEKFVKSKFFDIQSIRSLPVSSLLFRALVSKAAHDRHTDLKRFERFQVESLRAISAHSDTTRHETYEPFLSRDRELWIICSFTEARAHRQALRLVGQTDKLAAVYCHPTFTRHHRCTHDAVRVLSLSEFLRELSPTIHRRYIQHARFLINHLRQDHGDLDKHSQSDSICRTIRRTEQDVLIRTSDVREAKAGLGMVVATTADVAYVCACANLLNAALNRRLRTYDGSLKLAKEVYSFKAIFGRAMDEIFRNRPAGVEVYAEQGGLLYVSVCGLQFSFHAIPESPTLRAYRRSRDNMPQAWSGKKLQPVASLVLRWARLLVLEEGRQDRDG